MDSLSRTAHYLWKYRLTFLLSIVCALGIAACWCLNLSAAAPVVKVLFESDSLHQFVDQSIADAELTIATNTREIEELPASNVTQLARLQGRVSSATGTLSTYTNIKTYIMPWVPHDKFNTMVLIVAAIFIGSLIKGVFVYLQEILVGSVVTHTANDIRKDLFSSAQALDMQTVNSAGSSHMLSLMTNDIQQLTLGLSVFGTRLIREPLKAGACIFAAFYINWRLTLTAVLLVPLMGLFLARFGRMLKKASHNTLESVATIYDCISETFDSFKVVKAFGGEDRQDEQFRKANDTYYKHKMKCVKVNALIRPTSEMMALVVIVVAFTPGAYMVLRNTDTVFGIQLAEEAMTITQLLTMYILLAGVLDPVRKFSSVFGQIRQGMAGAERVFAAIDQQSKITEPEEPRELVKHHQSIAFEDVTFRYQPQDPTEDRSAVLRNVSVDVKFGEVVAVIGSNGSGKSTLLNLLPRFMEPEQGRISIDGIDISEYSSADLRSQIGLVSQETMLFNDTILENIRYGEFSATREHVTNAARQAHAMSFITDLPEGLDTVIGPGGNRLSGGQRQRIALARAIIRDPSIMILDEATSAVDAESEDLIHGVLKEFSKGRTVFIITHSLSDAFLDLVDRVIVMDQGQLVGVGTHAELSVSCPQYQRLLQSGTNTRSAA